MRWLGLDIGGANLKAADGSGWGRTVRFPLWREPAGLASALIALIESAPRVEKLAVTMTGELCDCFATKAEGVQHILRAVQEAAQAREVWIYRVGGRLVTLDEAKQWPEAAAAANWHALAQFACRFVKGESGLLVDVGSTTTDIVPLIDGMPRPAGLTDTERLLSGELVYTGVGRTPVCAITRTLPWRGGQCPVAAELFATAADAYVLLGKLREQPDAEWTADGRPLTKEFATARLARMICADSAEFSVGDAIKAAAAISRAQADAVSKAITEVAQCAAKPLRWAIVSGAGEFLATECVAQGSAAATVVSLSAALGEQASEAAPAHALAVLACERWANSSQKPAGNS
jgi:probable H4MPT-linked C1 transfer pathway protein